MPDLQSNKQFMCIYNNFINANNSEFCNTIGAFYDPLVFTLYFDEIKNTLPGYNKYTDGNTLRNYIHNNEITIYINETQLSPLHMAGTLLHEEIHAAIGAFLNDKNINVNLLNEEGLLREYAKANGSTKADHLW